MFCRDKFEGLVVGCGGRLDEDRSVEWRGAELEGRREGKTGMGGGGQGEIGSEGQVACWTGGMGGGDPGAEGLKAGLFARKGGQAPPEGYC